MKKKVLSYLVPSNKCVLLLVFVVVDDEIVAVFVLRMKEKQMSISIK